jgi:predicted nicotinamide N-methyase
MSPEEFDNRAELVSLGRTTVTVMRPIHLERHVDTESLLADSKAAEPPYWMHLWPGAMALARWLEAVGDLGRGARVLELGCGLALPSLVAARRGYRVVASDWKREPLSFALASAELTGVTLAALQMDWAAAALRGVFDVCVGADVAYDAEAEETLVAGLGRVVAPSGRIVLADSVNTYRKTLGERLEQAGWRLRISRAYEKEEGRNVWVRMIEARRG